MDHPGPKKSHDTISIRNLQLPADVMAPDIWGHEKLQPALLSLVLELAGPGFTSAADADALDDSTIHYGKLSKRIREECPTRGAGSSSPSLYWSAVPRLVGEVVDEMAKRSDGRRTVVGLTVELRLPKASLWSEDGVVFTAYFNWESSNSLASFLPSFRLEGVKVMVLVGVNAHERVARQPLVAGLTVEAAVTNRGFPEPFHSTIFGLEKVLVEVLEGTSYETLEALIEFTARELQRRLLSSIVPGGMLRLRLEKPRAIMFADAPAVEVWRSISPPAT